jgi:hypothetical protein
MVIFRDGSWHVDTNGDHVADVIFGYGITGDVPLVVDFNQDGNDDTVIFRDGGWHVDTTGLWIRNYRRLTGSWRHRSGWKR